MKRDAFTQQLDFDPELIIDNFAGGGGTSTGLEAAFGRPVDIAINHNEEALAMHALNHPFTHHLCESVWEVDPIAVTRNRPVALVWLSPDCKHFSKAKGGTPVKKEIRGLAWVGLKWAKLTKPRALMLENVEEFTTWGPLIVGPDGKHYPDPKKKGKTFQSFVRQLRQLGYEVEWKELRACDVGAPTIRKRLFLCARRDGLPIRFPDQSHGEAHSREVIAGLLAPYRTAAECIDFNLPAASIFDRKKPLAVNTLRRVAKGLWRHVLASPKPFIVTNTTGHAGASVDEPMATLTTGNQQMLGQPVIAPVTPAFYEHQRGAVRADSNPGSSALQDAGAGLAAGPALMPFLTEHANASSQRNMPANEPLRTICAQVKGGHISIVAPTLAPLRGTSEAHLNARGIDEPLSTISAGGTHHAMVAAHLAHLTHHGDRAGSAPDSPLPTVTCANRGEQALIAANLVDIGHGESCKTGAKRWSEGIRSIETPLNSVTASSSPSALTSAFFEQANGGFYEGDGRPASAPMSTITTSGSNQQLVTAYLVKYYSSGGQWQGLGEPMHTLPTKGRMGLVNAIRLKVTDLTREQRIKARKCALLLNHYLPEQFPVPVKMILMEHEGTWWVLVDITLRMLKARELYRAQSFPDSYIIHEIPDPKLLFKDGKQVPGDPRLIPRIPLTITSQIRMVGNSVAPVQAEEFARVNFAHEKLWQTAA